MADSYEQIKVFFDRLGALVLLIVLSPVLLLVSLLILAINGSPVLFRQERLTKNGQVFTIYKFRTMSADAETDSGAVWAAVGDPRVTALGRILRFSRLDELPQLCNVLRGEMSLIGPRPERPELALDLRKRFPSFDKRLKVKAGITGLAQTQVGYASSFESYRKKLAWDLLYIKQRSLWMDLLISLRTLVVIITGKGSR